MSNLLELRNVRKSYAINAGLLQRKIGVVHAVDGVSLEVHEKEALGLVGESGCGKSTLARLLLRLENPSSGRILFRGHDLHKLDKPQLRAFRNEVQIVFQDPQSSLDPRMSIGRSLLEALEVMSSDEKSRVERVAELLDMVGLDPSCADKYPHEFSGGEKQRIGIARAIARNPRLVVADEPVSALDVSIQAQVLNLLSDLRSKLDMGYVFIAHDLAVVKHISDRIAVMYLGKVVETAETEELFANPAHPYTRLLLASILACDPATRKYAVPASGEAVSAESSGGGCRFYPRCGQAMERCAVEEPGEVVISPGHTVRCYPTAP